MTMMKLKRAGTLLILLAVCLASIGCGDKQFVEQIAKFEAGINDTTTAVAVYYSELNTFEREIYLQEVWLDKKKQVGTSEVVGGKIVRTPLAGQVFSAESIKARIDAIQALGKYGSSLAKLAGTQAPAEFAAASKTAGENINGLVGTFRELSKPEKSDATAEAYVGPFGAIATIVGVIGQLVLEKKRDEALTKAVKEGAPQVRTIISLLEKDMKDVISPLRSTGTHQLLAGLVDRYNKNTKCLADGSPGCLNDDQRKKLLDEIRIAQVRYETAVAFNPSDLLSSLQKAHEALVEYAESGRKIQNLTQLVEALTVFRERAAIVAEAVLQLRELRRNS